MKANQTPSDRLCRLLEPHHSAVRATARRLCRSLADGDDLLHEAVLQALGHIEALRDESRFRAWFYAVLISVHRQRSRRALWRRFVPFWNPDDTDGKQLAEQALHAFTPPTLDEEARTRAARISAALQDLPAAQREAIVLFEVDGFSIEEIADLQRSTQSAVKSRLLRARQRLRDHYQALCLADEADSTGKDAAKDTNAGPWIPRRDAGS